MSVDDTPPEQLVLALRQSVRMTATVLLRFGERPNDSLN